MDKVRETGPYEIVCIQCGSRFGYTAPHPFLDRLMFATALIAKAQRTRGFADLAGYQKPGETPILPWFSYEKDSPEEKRQARHRIVDSGANRWSFHCKNGHSITIKHRRLLEAYLTAHENRSCLIPL